MKSTTFGIIAALALTLPACSSSDSSKKSDATLQEASVGSTETSSCTSKITMKYKYTDDNREETHVQEGTVNTTRKWTGTTADGFKQYELNGEYSLTSYKLAEDQSLTFEGKREYTYISKGEKKTEKLDGGLVKESGKYERVRTAKDGTVFYDADGKEQTTQTDSAFYEEVSKITGTKTALVSSKYNNKEVPGGSYTTETVQTGNTKYDLTTLDKPYTETDEGVEVTTLKDENICTTKFSK